MSKDKNPIPLDNNIIDISIDESMPENYLPYAVAVAKERALPDVRDGLKPVHRRILYGAYKLNALPDKPYYKSARIVGDILGKYHPHGDTSVYDAMVIMAQDFSTYCPLIDGHGNFGSIDGDSAAAMRYTESRLSKVAMTLLKDIDKNTVDFTPNYSDSEMEPSVLPARYPNLLVNGSFGIAVGLATNIPPHNLGETIDATCALIDNPDMKAPDLMKYLKGPDLPTGGELIGSQSLLSAYSTGEGKVALRAKTAIEKLDSGRMGIVIYEFPYRQNKSKILQTISEMTGDKKHSKNLESISDIRDESDREGIRAVVEFKKSASRDTIEKVLKYLLKKTNLQVNLSFNMIALANGKPETLSLVDILNHYVAHQKDVVKRRTATLLHNAEQRFHIVEGFIKAINIIDEVVATIRASKSKQDSIENLMKKYDFTETQADAIVTLMLYRLTNLEIKSFQKEHSALKKSIKELKAILNNERVLLDLLKSELLEVKSEFATPRKTMIISDDSSATIEVEEILIDEDIMITQSKDGFIKMLPLKTYNRVNSDIKEIENREDDYTKFVYASNTKDTILLFTDEGNMYQFKASLISEAKWKDKGIRLGEMLKSKTIDAETVIHVMSIKSFDDNKMITLLTDKCAVKCISLSKLGTTYLKTSISKIKKGEKIVTVVDSNDTDKTLNLLIESTLGIRFTRCLDVTDYIAEKSVLPQYITRIKDNDTIVTCSTLSEHTESDEKFVCLEDFSRITIGNHKDEKTSIHVSKEDYLVLITKDALATCIPFNDLWEAETINAFLFNKDVVAVEILRYSSIENNCLFLFTQKGTLKKLPAKELLKSTDEKVYKLKTDELIVSANISSDVESSIYIFSDSGYCLNFQSNTFTASGKNAGGITGMKLKDSNVLLGVALDNETNFDVYLNNNKKPIILADIESKNKGTLGVIHAKNVKTISIKRR